MDTSLWNESIVTLIGFLLSVMVAISVHEFAHAWVADRLGDDTPRLQGRVTLNPMAHLDPMGSLLFVLSGFRFGWGKPVIINPMRLPRQSDELKVALAGPISNLLFATLFNLIAFAAQTSFPVFAGFLDLAATINIGLAAFNLLPIPPLDGSSIVAYFWPEYRSILGSQIGIVLVLLLLFLPMFGGQSLLIVLIQPLTFFFRNITHFYGLI